MGIRTCLGITRIGEYGPFQDGLPSTFVDSNFQQFDFAEAKIQKSVKRFLNVPGRNVTQAREMTEDEFKEILSNLRNPIDLLFQ